LPEISISIANAVFEATQSLREAGVPEPRRDAGTLLAHALGRDLTFIITHADDPIDDVSLKAFVVYVQRRAQGEPVQYITGRQQFFGLDFQVTPDVLIPRPETELLVEAGLDLLSESIASPFICDVGTGTGCIVVALLRSIPNARAVAIDISEAAVRVAVANAASHGVRERIDFVVSDSFSSLSASVPVFNLIVSNPPYVSTSAFKGLQREVRNHEPAIALTAGDDGLSIVRRLLNESPQYLKEDGYVLFEIGFDQGNTVRKMVDRGLWNFLDIKPDLQGIPRIVLLQKSSQ
jgi:release factor glutamine methyltransferase